MNRGTVDAWARSVLVLAALVAGACGEGGDSSGDGTGMPSGVVGSAGSGAGATVGQASPEHADAIADATDFLQSFMEEESIPGLSVAVAEGTEVIWSQGFGYADLTHRVKVTPLTRFRVGSVSKPFTAAGLALLVEQGQADLDAPVQSYVPSFPRKPWEVTTRQLAGHLGGIRHYLGDENLSMASYPDVASGLAIFADDALINTPGTEYSYSSYGWNLISAVMEGASGEPFLEFMQREVFDPLGMANTVADHVRPVVPNRTRFYTRGGDGAVVNAPYVDNSYKWAGGGFLSTPEDMLAFAAAHLDPGYLQAETLEALFTSQTTTDGVETGYGIGWSTDTNNRGERIVSHTGGSVGGRTVLLVNRDARLIVAATANLSSAPMSTRLAAGIAELFRESE